MRVYGLGGEEEKLRRASCVRCGEIITNPISQGTVTTLTNLISEFISKEISNRHAKEVMKKIRERMDWQKELMGYAGKYDPICRFCLFDLAALYIKGKNRRFEKEIIERYDFI